MLILVGVTITVALNGGIFKKAETATKQTQIAVDREELLSAVAAAIGTDGKVIFEEVGKNLSKGWTWDEGTDSRTYTSPKGNKFIVNANGKIEYIGDGENGGDNPGGDQPGGGEENPPVTPSEPWVDNGNGTFTKGDTTVEIGKTTYTNNEVQEKLGATGGTYTGTWTVIGVEGDKLKLVSTKDVDSCTLGYNDPGAIAAIQVEDESNPTDAEKYERSIWSYKNAVDTLDSVAQRATGIENAKSITIEDIYGIIGEENLDKDTHYGDIYEYYFDASKSKVCSRGIDENGEEKWKTPITTPYDAQTFVNSGGETIVIDKNNSSATVRLTYDAIYYKLTDDQWSALGPVGFGAFWLGRRYMDCNTFYANYGVSFSNGGNGYTSVLFSSYSADSAKTVAKNVRAIVTF